MARGRNDGDRPAAYGVYFSMMTIRLAVLAIAAGGLLACAQSSSPTEAEWDDDALAQPSWAVAPERAAEFEGAYPFRYYSGVDETERLVIRDAAAWTALWARLSAGMLPQPPLPAVDFATELVLFVSQGAKPTGGHTIDIRAVVQSPGALEVLVESASPGPSCVTTQAFTQATDVLVIPRTPLGVTFLERHRVHQCD